MISFATQKCRFWLGLVPGLRTDYQPADEDEDRKPDGDRDRLIPLWNSRSHRAKQQCHDNAPNDSKTELSEVHGATLRERTVSEST
jgi:hypothetical protein